MALLSQWQNSCFCRRWWQIQEENKRKSTLRHSVRFNKIHCVNKPVNSIVCVGTGWLIMALYHNGVSWERSLWLCDFPVLSLFSHTGSTHTSYLSTSQAPAANSSNPQIILMVGVSWEIRQLHTGMTGDSFRGCGPFFHTEVIRAPTIQFSVPLWL